MKLIDYIGLTYLDSGRDYPNFDCWGLVHHAAKHLYGIEGLPAFTNVAGRDYRGMTAATKEVKAKQISAPEEGCIALAWRGNLAHHAGLVVGHPEGLRILDTRAKRGSGLHTTQGFEMNFQKVTYYVVS